MLKLKNVSKFYYNKGVIASGFSKVNIEFDIGEFVVITGESGSGKSTLLNVISGLDSYEEGEMYIDGLETSHYGNCELDEYRKKYVSNIFQNFNLVNSYTVYQNVELVLLMNGYKRKEVKDKVCDLIEQVNLTKYKHTKVSKLSGGQKQRVAIARALAKETPIIVCDEPTANLDSKASKEVISILKKVSKNKLVIMVTHDFKSVENIATRVVKMHDGKIVSDKKLKDNEILDKVEIKKQETKKIGILNIIRLGIRNTFNIVPKFILMFVVFLFVTASIITVYGTLKKSEYEAMKLGYNYYFSDTSDTRIIIKKKDGTAINKDDLKTIKTLNNIDKVVEFDLLLDRYLWFDTCDDTGYYLGGLIRSIDEFNGKLDYGRMPTNDNEVIVLVNDYEYAFKDMVEDAVTKTYYLNGDINNLAINVVGVKYIDDDMFNSSENIIYGSNDLLSKYMVIANKDYSDILVNINNKNYNSYSDSGSPFYITTSDKVSRGNAIISEDLSYACANFDCKNKIMKISVNNLYFQDNLELKIKNVYNSKNVLNLVGINKDSNKYGAIFINPEDYDQILKKDSYQASVFASSVDNVDKLSNELEDLGYKTLQMRLILNNEGRDMQKVIKIIQLVVTIILVITLFFISYFVIKLILKSRNIYFSTLRILGASVKNVKRILDVELLFNASLAYLTYIIFLGLVKNNLLEISFIHDAIGYLRVRDYLLMYIILIMMSYLISSRFSSKIFKKSAMNAYREEV